MRSHAVRGSLLVLGGLVLGGLFALLDRQPRIGTSGAPEVWWETLGELDYRTGAISAALGAVDGEIVRIPGFMVPLDDEANWVTEFLLVPYAGACVHVPAPPPNHIVWVRMESADPVPVRWWDPVWVEGRLRIQAVESVYGSVGYQMTGDRVELYVGDEGVDE